MAVIDVVSWDSFDSAGSNPVFAWKFTTTKGKDADHNLSTFTQLIVRESQEAVLFSKGQILGKFGPGKHTLNTENLPLLRKLYGLPFGGKNPFMAEVWFVNKLIPLNIDWDTSSMMYHDPDYQAMVPIKAVGRYGLRVQDAERFLVKLVGSAGGFTAVSLTDQFSGALNAKTKTSLLSYMQSQHIGIKSISAYLEPLSQALKASMMAFWEDYGFSLEGFYITSIEVDTSHPDGKLIRDAIGRQSAQLIGGYSWQQSKAFEVADTAVSSMAEGKGGPARCLDDDQCYGKRRCGQHSFAATTGSYPLVGGFWAGWIRRDSATSGCLLLKLLKEILQQRQILSALWRSLYALPTLRI
jgi:membrane protease subunit (stomatin/prohibitin family)